MKVVVDTNVTVSALINSNGTPAKVLAIILNGKVTILFDNRIIFEYKEVLSRKDFGFNAETVNDLIDFFKHEGEFISAEHEKIKFHDAADKKFYEVFKSAKAHYLITGNTKHFPKEKGIVTPRDFLEL